MNVTLPEEGDNGGAVPDEDFARRKDEIEAELLRGLASGPGTEATPEYWAERQRVLQERQARRVTPAGFVQGPVGSSGGASSS